MQTTPELNPNILDLPNLLNIPIITLIALIIIISALISLFFIHRKKTALEKQFYYLMLDFENLTDELLNLQYNVENQRSASKVNLPANIIPILDIYENSNIRIPVDVLEELIRMSNRLDSDKLIFDYIENQRLYWKHENSKKPYMKVK